MKQMIPIEYRDFYDVPRMFLVSQGDQAYLFDCPFDKGQDEHPDHYTVYLMPMLTAADRAGSWLELRFRAISEIGTLPIGAVSKI